MQPSKFGLIGHEDMNEVATCPTNSNMVLEGECRRGVQINKTSLWISFTQLY